MWRFRIINFLDVNDVKKFLNTVPFFKQGVEKRFLSGGGGGGLGGIIGGGLGGIIGGITGVLWPGCLFVCSSSGGGGTTLLKIILLYNVF